MYIYRYKSSCSPSQRKRLGFRECDSFMRSLYCVLSNTVFKSLLLTLYQTLSAAAQRVVKSRQSMMKTQKTVRNCQYFLKSGSHSPPDDCFSGFPFKWDTEYDQEWNLWVLDKQPKSAQTEQTQGQPQHRRRRSATAEQIERLRAFPKKITREINFSTFLKNKSQSVTHFPGPKNRVS